MSWYVSKQCSVGIVVAKRLHPTVVCQSVGSEGMLVSLTLSVNGLEFTVTSVCCPCPSADRVRFFDSVLEPLIGTPHHLILGHFSTVLNPVLLLLCLMQKKLS